MGEQLKITLTLKALERLIGDDMQAAIEIRQGIAAEFARRHLKVVFNEVIQQQMNVFRAEVSKCASAELYDALHNRPYTPSASCYLHPNMKQDIGKAVREELKSVIAAETHAAVAALDLKAYVSNLIEKEMKDIVTRAAKNKFDTMLSEIVKQM